MQLKIYFNLLITYCDRLFNLNRLYFYSIIICTFCVNCSNKQNHIVYDKILSNNNCIKIEGNNCKDTICIQYYNKDKLSTEYIFNGLNNPTKIEYYEDGCIKYKGKLTFDSNLEPQHNFISQQSKIILKHEIASQNIKDVYILSDEKKNVTITANTFFFVETYIENYHPTQYKVYIQEFGTKNKNIVELKSMWDINPLDIYSGVYYFQTKNQNYKINIFLKDTNNNDPIDHTNSICYTLDVKMI